MQLVHVVPGRAPRAPRRAPQVADAAARVGGSGGPTWASRRLVVGSVWCWIFTRAALIEPITFAVHLKDVDVVGEPVEQRAGEAFGAEHLGLFVEG